ncbi:protein FAM107B isoform X1 [Amyelois transitella]|uniref:protein FAM107B isoform X1 n=2 Tax=Amyelois transitella TaxID=680683 RepID=UPI00298FA70F|nr:protein FAM107B isoform X1 [Amyelois transitella]
MPSRKCQQKQILLSVSAVSATGGGVVSAESQCALAQLVDMVQEGEAGAGDGLIAPRRLPNPYLESPQRMDLHRELLFNQRIGKNVLNQKSELQKALSKHKEKQIMNQVKEHKETPELERAIAERARRLEQAEQSTEEVETGTNPTLQEVRARLRHAAPSPAAGAH